MARRYIRTLAMDRLGDNLQAVDEVCEELAGNLRDKIPYSFSNSDGWQVVDDGGEFNDVLATTVTNGTFVGDVRMTQVMDLRQGTDGMVRQATLRIAAECSNSKRKSARDFKMGMEQKTGAVFGVVGGIVVAAIASIAEILLLDMLHLYLPVIAFAVGYGIGSAVGHMSGGAVGGLVGKSFGKTERHEERTFDRSMEDWEAFVDELIIAVDEFSPRVETTPSSATVI
jgi:hypothetical protein